MKCENCIHHEICRANALDQFHDIDCEYFKDKDFYVELPCLPGDKYYVVRKLCTEGGDLTTPEIHGMSDCETCYVDDCDKFYIVCEYQFTSKLEIMYKMNDIGSHYFLDEDSARQLCDKLTKGR